MMRESVLDKGSLGTKGGCICSKHPDFFFNNNLPSDAVWIGIHFPVLENGAHRVREVMGDAKSMDSQKSYSTNTNPTKKKKKKKK